MFSLIISIIAIALVSALALASIYYGGEAFKDGASDAQSSTLINQGQQIQGAVTLADLDDQYTEGTTTLANLVPTYLKEAPSFDGVSWDITSTVGEARIIVDTADICAKVEEQAGRDTTIDTTAGGGQFGCYDVGSNVYTVYYAL